MHTTHHTLRYTIHCTLYTTCSIHYLSMNLSLSLYLYVCMYVYIYIYIYTHMLRYNDIRYTICDVRFVMYHTQYAILRYDKTRQFDTIGLFCSLTYSASCFPGDRCTWRPAEYSSLIRSAVRSIISMHLSKRLHHRCSIVWCAMMMPYISCYTFIH